MPTPMLPLLRALLESLNIPIIPPSVSSTPPSLLLLILETILQERLPLSPTARLCNTEADELIVVKCLLGVVGMDELGMDLTVVDPWEVVRGDEKTLGVVIMALVVIATRHGIAISLPSPRSEVGEEEGHWSFEREEEEAEDLPEPLIPDISFSSPIQAPKVPGDVFAHVRGDRGGRALFDVPKIPLERDERITPQSAIFPLGIQAFDPYDTPLPPRSKGEDMDVLVPSGDKALPGGWQGGEAANGRHVGTHLDFVQQSRRPSLKDSWSTSEGTSSSHRTVLQDMLEEFGLGLDK